MLHHASRCGAPYTSTLGRSVPQVKRLAFVLLSAPLAGCVGTIDSLHTVEGEAPTNASCEVRITEAGTPRLVKKQEVEGKFSVTYVASGPFPSEIDVTAFCGGAKVKEVKNVSPRREGTVSLGIIAP